MAKWEKRWNTPQEYIKYTYSTWGLFDLEKDELIKKDCDGNPIGCGLIDPNLMGTIVYGAQLGHTDPHLARMEIKLWCQRCEQKTREFIREIRQMKEEGKKINKPNFLDQVLEKINSFRNHNKGGCTPHCLWWEYYQAKRDNVYKKYEVKNEVDLDWEIDHL